MAILYDPPSGWKYGFPRVYKPAPGEKLEDTLIRDGYPPKDAAFGSEHCSFSGTDEEILAVMASLNDLEL